MTDIYHWWREATQGRIGPVHADHPEAGRYALKRGDRLLPVAIGPDASGNIAALVDGQPADAAEIWISCAKRPVTQDAYKARMRDGHWPDEPTPMGHNMPSDPFEALCAEADDKCTQANELLDKTPSIRSQTTCDLFRNMQAQLLALIKRADAMHKGEKDPVLEQGRAIDEKFRFRASVKVFADRLRQRFEAFMSAEERRLKEEADVRYRAERAAAEAERNRIAEEMAKKMADDPIAALTSDPPEMPELPLAPEPVKVSAGGGFGRKAGLRTEYVPHIEDLKAAVAHFIDHPDILAAVEKLVRAAVKTSKGTAKIPGVVIKEERRAA